eukprot:TRINITY_DN5394_c0_g1_i1.p1 TRINITY_DN5394_c0_g1~~TRINITY_DN5394_c0_g1_i1.p1  ORF type:complete len:141 (-),score=21.94 TRINITY_DN5394_c0_g1_i1:160-582(-)
MIGSRNGEDSITDEGIVAIGDGLSSLTRLTHLTLQPSDPTEDNGASRTIDAISSLQYLSSLVLVIDNEKVTNVTGNKIGNLLRNQTSLVDIMIDIDGTKITQDLKEDIYSIKNTRHFHRFLFGNQAYKEFGNAVMSRFFE